MMRKALLVGINDYAPVGPGGPDLRGCVNDVRDVAHTLNSLGIVPASPGGMRILTDSRASRANILDGVNWLIRGARKGDVLICYYSGHGSYVADISGDELDHKDETICPHDFASAGMITDDVLRSAFSGVARGVNLDVIFDSCHSGTATREIAGRAVLSEEEAYTVRFVEPPVDYGYLLDANPTVPVRRIFRSNSEEGEEVEEAGEGQGARQVVVVPGLNHVLWAGCRDNQTSAEAVIGGVVRGIFTYCFCRALRRAGVCITRRRLDGLVCVDVKNLGYAQVPQLEGSLVSIGEKVFT